MKERKYKEDWVNEARFDDRTGRETRSPVYRGDWFRFPEGASPRRLSAEALLSWAGYIALFVIYFKLNFPGTAVLYVFLPAALALFPALYWALGAAALFRAQERMTRLQKENGPGRVLRSAAGCTVCSAAALLGDLVFLIAGHQAEKEWPGACIIFAAAAVACAALNRFRAADRKIVKEEGSL